MPIYDLQRRIREIGRVRLGDTVEGVSRNGQPYNRPVKLETFRLTSRDEQVILAAAERYGGMAQPWGEQWEVTTETAELEVVVPPTEMAFSQWWEAWTSGRCQRRCDGRREIISDEPCLCDPEARVCTPHTRLSVILHALPGVGVWRLDTQGWHAATELAGIVDLLQAAAERGVLIPARLRLEQREVKREIDTEQGPKLTTFKFAVPVLDISTTFAGLAQHGGLDLGPGFTPVPQLPPAPTAPIAEQVVVTPVDRAPRANAAEPIRSTGMRPRALTAVPTRPDGDYDEWPKPALVAECRARNLRIDGNKPELIEKLRASDGAAPAAEMFSDEPF